MTRRILHEARMHKHTEKTTDDLSRFNTPRGEQSKAGNISIIISRQTRTFLVARHEPKNQLSELVSFGPGQLSKDKCPAVVTAP